MVEQDSVACVETIAIAVVHSHPEDVYLYLRAGVGAPRAERRGFVLGQQGSPEHLRARRLVVTRLDPTAADRLQQPCGPQPGHVPRVLGSIEAHPHVGLRSQVVDLIRLNVVDQVHKLLAVIQVPSEETTLRLAGADPGRDGRCDPC